LTAALQGVHPLSLDFVADPAELAVAVVQGEVLVEAAQHHREVLLLLASRPMSVSKQPLAGAGEELSAALGAGDTDQGETPCSIRPTDVLEAQKLKRLWPLSVLAPFDGRKTPKEQQPSFLLGQFQIELRKTFPQLAMEVLRVSPELEASHKIIRETHQVCLALALRFEFLFKPQVEREVQVNVTQHRRYWAALWRTLLGRDECPIDHRPGLKPFSNQLKNCRVSDPMGHHHH
jgi:hypothetical protein